MGRGALRITADTNILVRALTEDDPTQTSLAQSVLEDAELVALPLVVLCELVWVLSQGYRLPRTDIAGALRRLTTGSNVALNRPAAEAGLAMLQAGGDFADGVIAYEGAWLGGDEFVSFDRKAVAVLQDAGRAARLLG